MSKTWAIARNTFREAVRDRILYGLLAFAVLMVGSSLALAELSIGQQDRITKDLGLTAISVISVLMSVFLGISLVSKEVERRTVYTILSKPIRRWQLVLGKYLGLSATVALNVSVMGATLALMLLAFGWWSGNVAAAVGLIVVETVVLVAFATLFSTFTTPTLAAIFTLGLFVVGHLTGALRAITERSALASVRLLGEAVYRVVPNLEAFNVKGRVAVGDPVAAAEVWLGAGYGALYVAAALALAAIVFERRELR